MFKQVALNGSNPLASLPSSKATNQVTSPLAGNIILMACALALALTAGAAQAASSASATLGPISIAASGGSVSFDVANHPTLAYTGAYDISTFDYVYRAQYSAEPYGSVASSSAITHAGASASALAGADIASPAGASYRASGYSNGTELAYSYSSYEAGAESNWRVYTPFTIEANTTLTFSALATVSAATTLGYDPKFESYEYASAGTYFHAYVFGETSGYDAVLSTSVVYDYSYDPDTDVYNYFGTSDSKSGVLELSVSNTSDEVQYGYFQVSAQVYGYSALVIAVPEPDSHAMLLAGIGLVGFAARRHMKQAQP